MYAIQAQVVNMYDLLIKVGLKHYLISFLWLDKGHACFHPGDQNIDL